MFAGIGYLMVKEPFSILLMLLACVTALSNWII